MPESILIVYAGAGEKSAGGEGMRMARWKADRNAKVAHYHCLSRVVDRRFVLGPDEKEHFIRLMRGYETFCGVKVVTFCILSNHFHILVEVPRRPAPVGEK